MTRFRAGAIWAALAMALAVPIIAAAGSPLLAYRQPIYIIAGFAGVTALALLLVQPLLAGDRLPGLSMVRSRAMHRWVGFGLVSAVALHVGALWITSPPDVVDALLFRSPTWFSIWGVVAMWAVFGTALLFTRRASLGPRIWRRAHSVLVIIIVAATIAHAMLIDGTMEIMSKTLLCILVVWATAGLIYQRRAWAKRR